MWASPKNKLVLRFLEIYFWKTWNLFKTKIDFGFFNQNHHKCDLKSNQNHFPKSWFEIQSKSLKMWLKIPILIVAIENRQFTASYINQKAPIFWALLKKSSPRLGPSLNVEPSLGSDPSLATTRVAETLTKLMKCQNSTYCPGTMHGKYRSVCLVKDKLTSSDMQFWKKGAIRSPYPIVENLKRTCNICR